METVFGMWWFTMLFCLFLNTFEILHKKQDQKQWKRSPQGKGYISLCKASDYNG